MTTPTAEQKRLYQAIVRETAWASAQGVTRPRLDEEGLLVDWLRDTRAVVMKLEFEREHGHCEKLEYVEGVAVAISLDCDDPRHNWAFEQWRQAAEKLYREG